jgi:acyl carrier protein
MPALSRDEVRALMADVLAAQGKSAPEGDDVELESIGFRSLDFSELALRVEDEVGTELNFDAPELRSIRTVGDVLDFLDQLQAA